MLKTIEDIVGETVKFGYIGLNKVNITSIGETGNLPNKNERKNIKIGRKNKAIIVKYLL
jgi:hypothetical protein